MRNKLLEPEVSQRCTGRSTALILDVLARAVGKQGSVHYARDHHAGTRASEMAFTHAVQATADKLGLKYMDITFVSSSGQYDGYTRVVSNIWEK